MGGIDGSKVIDVPAHTAELGGERYPPNETCERASNPEAH